MKRYEINNGGDQPRRFGGEWVNPGEAKTVTIRAMDPALVAKWRRVGVRVSEVVDARPEAVVSESAAVFEPLPEASEEERVSLPLDPPTRHSWEPREEQETVDIEGWRDITDWPALRSLAASVSKHPIRSRADAVAALEAEEGRRG